MREKGGREGGRREGRESKDEESGETKREKEGGTEGGIEGGMVRGWDGSNWKPLTHNKKSLRNIALSPGSNTAIHQCSSTTVGTECGPASPFSHLPQLYRAIRSTKSHLTTRLTGSQGRDALSFQ